MGPVGLGTKDHCVGESQQDNSDKIQAAAAFLLGKNHRYHLDRRLGWPQSHFFSYTTRDTQQVSIGQGSELIFGRCSVRVSAGTKALLSKVS
jgi:hypothetical protein